MAPPSPVPEVRADPRVSATRPLRAKSERAHARRQTAALDDVQSRVCKAVLLLRLAEARVRSLSDGTLGNRPLRKHGAGARWLPQCLASRRVSVDSLWRQALPDALIRPWTRWGAAAADPVRRARRDLDCLPGDGHHKPVHAGLIRLRPTGSRADAVGRRCAAFAIG
jgi:hypothetical protein